MFDIEKMRARGMEPRMIEICQQINENSAKRDSCPCHDFEKGSRRGDYVCKNCGCKVGPEFMVGYRQGLKHGKEGAGNE